MPDLVSETILADWGVPREEWEGLVPEDGCHLILDIHEVLRSHNPTRVRPSREWMTRPNSDPFFEGLPPMAKLLEPGGLTAIHQLVCKQV